MGSTRFDELRTILALGRAASANNNADLQTEPV